MKKRISMSTPCWIGNYPDLCYTFITHTPYTALIKTDRPTVPKMVPYPRTRTKSRNRFSCADFWATVSLALWPWSHIVRGQNVFRNFFRHSQRNPLALMSPSTDCYPVKTNSYRNKRLNNRLIVKTVSAPATVRLSVVSHTQCWASLTVFVTVTALSTSQNKWQI